MRVSEKWLREWVDPAVDTQQLAHTLTMAGLEVDAIEPAAHKFSGVVIAEVLEVAPHTDAKKLQVCKVNDGTEVAQVICGASNVRAGLKVAFAKVGACLPNDFKIEAKALRGVDSFGMLCSASELGMAEDAQGILELPTECELGADFFASLDLDDSIIDIDLTPNRSDCLSIHGVAREVSALLDSPLKTPVKQAVDNPSSQKTFPVSIQVAEHCPRYVGRVIEGVSGAAQSPLWLQEKLRRAGVRSINAIIDITNFVMLELGQPMHAFDSSKLNKGIIVRFAEAKEALTLLDEQKIEMSADDLVIADESGAVALAGIMGGASTAVDHATSDIFIESACFKAETIAGKARRYGLHTDSSHRFERGVDAELATKAMQRATQLILEIVGGNAGPIICEEDQASLPEVKKIALQQSRVEKLLGIQISTKEIEQLLQRLQCAVEVDKDSLQVTPPSFRFDLQIDVDLIEEVARLVGYENIPAKVNTFVAENKAQVPDTDKLMSLKQALVQHGYHEVVTFSFGDQRTEELLSPNHSGKVLANPISQDLSVMRSSIWPGLIKAAQYNLHRQQKRIRIFEYGLQFVHENDVFLQLPNLSGLVTGDAMPLQWGAAPNEVDFYDIKGEVERLLEVLGISNQQISFVTCDDAALHPGQSANILYKDETAGEAVIGRLGKLHPAIQATLDIDQTLYLFELKLSNLMHVKQVSLFQPLSKYPSIRRDITLLVDKNVEAAVIRSNIEQMQINALQKIKVISVYTGKGIPESKKSISLGLILQEFSRTLTDKEIEKTILSIISQLNEKVGAEIRN